MDVVVAGGHGQIGLRLLRLLAEKGHRARGLVRSPEHVQDLADVGAEAVRCDMEELDDLSGCCAGADAVVFAAGAGPGSGAARKETVDRDAAILVADAALEAGVSRYVIVSSIGANKRADDPGTDPVFAAYLRAKAAADRAVQARTGLDATIVRPGHLTDEPGTGRVAIAESTDLGSIPRADVAAVLVAALDTPGAGGHAFDLIGGDSPIAEAVAAL
jgi:uncharacterized protein YbjT (DUF2867 family)